MTGEGQTAAALSGGRSFFYEAGPLTLRSFAPLEGLRPSTESDHCLTLEIVPQGTVKTPSQRWHHHWQRGNTIWASFAETREGLLIEFRDEAVFLILTSNRAAMAEALGETPEYRVRSLFTDQVIPVLLARMGLIVVHGAAVSTPHGAALLLGGAGAGKSVLASMFAANGYPLIADDAFLLARSTTGPAAISLFPAVRLAVPAASRILGTGDPEETGPSQAKSRLDLTALDLPVATGPVPTRCLFHLTGPGSADSGEPGIEKLDSREAFVALTGHLYRSDHSRETLRRESEFVQYVVNSCGAYSLAYQRRFDTLPRVVNSVLAQMSSTDA